MLHKAASHDRLILPEPEQARQLATLRDRRPCPVCRFPFQLITGLRAHDEGAEFATLLFGCSDPAVIERRRIGQPDTFNPNARHPSYPAVHCEAVTQQLPVLA